MATSTNSASHVSRASRPARNVKQLSPADAAVRLMSETAHDIRAPLATIRESVRLVHDGGLGEMTTDQRECLAAAIDQCNCVDQMVGEMVQLERLRTGIPRVRRVWTTAHQIRDSIEVTLKPWTLPRGIKVLWDLPVDESLRVFGDPSMIRRLVVNLVCNAIRETPEGGAVLVRAQPIKQGQVLRWSVVDQGRGMSESEMHEIAQRQVSNGGGEGLGLSICRQLSALHFSPLRIESRKGTGTAVSFETVIGGPKTIAEAWTHWRNAQREPLRKPVNRYAVSDDAARKIRPPRQMRFDSPTVIVELSSEGSRPVVDDRVSIGTVTVGATMPRQVADEFDTLLQGQLRMFDFAYRVDPRQWVWVFDANAGQADERIDSIGDIASKKISTIRLSWSDPQVIPLNQRRTANRLTELLVRQSLSCHSAVVTDVDDVRPGTEPIKESVVAAERLDEELRRMAERLSRHNDQMQQQARRLRPEF